MTRNPVLRLELDEIIADGFAGGGGASTGMESALGRKVDIAINHDPEAIAMHMANHPETEHYIEDIYDVDPRVVCRGKRVGVMWFSPDCTEHSRAKNGSIKRDKKVRCLANVILTWAGSVRPRVIVVENVLEFEDWGPLDDEDKIDKLRKGEFFKFWWRRLEHMGYRGEMRALKAHDYGAPTSRERLYIVWRCDGGEIGWPDISHGPKGYEPYRTAAECIDYSRPCPSIFLTADEARQLYKDTGVRCNRPLSDNTMARIARGMHKYVLGAEKPFVIPTTHPRDQRVHDIDEPFRTITAANRGELGYVETMLSPFSVPAKSWGGGGNDARSLERPMRTITCSKRGEYGLVAPTLVQTGYGERPGQAPRCLDLQRPLGTIISGGTGGNGKHGLVAAYLTKEFSQRDTGGWNGGQSVQAPMGSVTCRDHHRLVLAFLSRFNGQSVGQDLRLPLGTIDCTDRYALVVVGGETYAISDIGFRMLEPRELFRAQGFPDSYIIDPLFDYRYTSSKGRVRIVRKPLTETAQVDKCGNSVSPPVARSIIRANFPLTAAEVAPLRRSA